MDRLNLPIPVYGDGTQIREWIWVEGGVTAGITGEFIPLYWYIASLVSVKMNGTYFYHEFRIVN